jgi:signal transduction histidine kinase
MKIRTRLSIHFIIITTIIYCFSLAFIYTLFKEHTESEFYLLLENKARMTAEMVLFHEDELRPDSNASKKNHTIQLQDLGNTSIYNPQFQRVYSLIGSAPMAPIPALQQIKNQGEYAFNLQQNSAYGFKYTSRKNNEYLVVSEEKPDYAKLYKLRNILLISTFITIAILIFSGWLFGRQSLRTFSKTIQDINNILPMDLSKRLLPGKNEDELNQLIFTFNQLLERIDLAFKTEKSFISNVSHELKNPIASIQSQIQYATHKDRTIDEYRRVLISLQEDINEMAHMVEKLLQLARIQNNVNPVAFGPVRIDEILFQCRENIIKSYPGYKITIQFDSVPAEEEEMQIQGDETLLRLAIYNLMENACKFSPDHTCNLAIVYTESKQIQIHIQNQSSLLDPKDLDQLFKPFYRSIHHNQIKGSGIGLSLVKAILQHHQIPIVVSSHREKGIEFVLTLKPHPSDTEIASNPHTMTSVGISNVSNSVLTWVLVCLVSLDWHCTSIPHASGKKESQIITAWYKQLLELNRYTEGYRPPVSARTFAYIGLGAWTCLAAQDKNYNLLESQLDSFHIQVPETMPVKNLALSLNAYYYQISKAFYPHALMTSKEKMNRLYNELLQGAEFQTADSNHQASIRLGRSIADQIYSYASSDSTAHMAYLFNYDPEFSLQDSPGVWRPGLDQMPALLPRWGQTRMFLRSMHQLTVPEPPSYSEAHQSEWFKQAWEIYTISQSLSYEQKWIAEFWSDDFHGVTFCSASRWVSIAIDLLDKNQALSVDQKLKALCQLGIGLNDAAVLTWRSKYTYAMERPETFIRRVIDKNWKPFHDSPSFPSYPSGHSIFGSVGTGILTEYVQANQFPYRDKSHIGRKEFLSKPRSFNSLQEMAEENARSRLYMGVHYRHDCEEGLELGYAVADKVLQMRFDNKWTKD